MKSQHWSFLARTGTGFLIIALLLLSMTAPAYGQDEVKIGVLANRGTEIALKEWQPTADYLSNKTGYSFVIVPLDSKNISAAVGQGEVDFVLTNPGNYVELEAGYKAARIATLQTLVHNEEYTVYGAVIFTKADRYDINELHDLESRSFMAVGEKNFGGWQMGLRELEENNIDIIDFSEIKFSGYPQDLVVYAVQRGEVDAGTVRTGILESMAQEGRINLSEFKVLNQQMHDDFPLLHSTRLYPEWVFAKVEHTSDKLAEHVGAALIEMPQNSAAAKAANIAGFAIPLNYQPVHELMKELRIGPYRAYEEITFGEAVKKYWYWIVLAIAAAVLLTFIKLNVELEQNVKKRTAELEKVNVELQREVTERKQAEKRIQHLNNTLGAIRNVNQLITREKDRERLVQKSCGLLVENRGWELAWILLVDKDQSYITAASAGVDEQFSILVEQMKRGNYPRCVRDTLIQGEPFIACDDVRKKHKECDLSNCPAGGGAFAARLEHEGKVYGTITVGVLPELVLDREERSLFQELVTDLSYALASIESEEERQRAEEALRDASLYTRSLIEVSLDPLVTISKDGKITDVNHATESVTGVSREKLIGSDFSDYFTEPEKAREGYQKVFEKGFVRDYPLAIRHVSGSTIDVLYNASVYNDAAGNAAGVFAAARDITARKKAEETLRKTEEKFRNVIENIFKFVPEGLVVLTDKLNLFRRNKAFEDLVRQYAVKLNYSEEELADILIEQIKTRLVSGEKSEIKISRKHK